MNLRSSYNESGITISLLKRACFCTRTCLITAFWASQYMAMLYSYNCDAFTLHTGFSVSKHSLSSQTKNSIFLDHFHPRRDHLILRINDVNAQDGRSDIDVNLIEKFTDVDSFNNELNKIVYQQFSAFDLGHIEKKLKTKQPKKENVLKAERLLEAMERTLMECKNENDGGSTHRVNIYSYTTLLLAWAKCGEAQKAHDLLQRMIDQTITKKSHKQNRKYSERIIPNTVAFNIVINAWAKLDISSSDFPTAAEKALELLQLMEDQSTIATISNKACIFAPSIVTYNGVMNCIGRSGRGLEGAKQVESILTGIAFNTIQYSSKENNDLRLNDVSFGTVLSAYAKSATAVEGGILAAQKAEELLELMEEMYMNKTISMGPTTFCVNTVMNAWSQVAASSKNKREKHQAAERAEQILIRMEYLYNDKNRIELRPNTVSYNTVLGAWAKSCVRGAPDRAEAILHKMDQLSKENSDDEVAPDNISFNTVLHAWARSDSKWAAKRAQSILRHMDKLHENGNKLIQPDTVTYSTCINAWARSASSRTFLKQKDSISPAKNAESILRRMEYVFSNGLNHRAKPNILAYNAVLNAWSKSGDENAAKQACSILESMEMNPDIQPDVYSFTSTINACAKAKDAQMAEAILEKMENLYKATGNLSVKPNIRSYTSVINAYSRSGRGQSSNPEKAERILHRMETQFDSGGHNDLQPDTVCYNAVINSYGWSKNVPNKAEKAKEIFLKMKALYQSKKNTAAKPDIVTCNSVLNCCAYTSAKEEQSQALDIAVSVYEMCMDDPILFGKLNHITYGNMILSCTNLVPVSSEQNINDTQVNDLAKMKRRKLVETVWWHCCQDGKVSTFVLSKFLQALSFDHEIIFEIIGKSNDRFFNEEYDPNQVDIHVHDLPIEWTRSAGEDLAILKDSRGLNSNYRSKRIGPQGKRNNK